MPNLLVAWRKKKIVKFVTKRITYYIDQSGTIRALYDNLFDAENHLEQIKLGIERLTQSELTN